MYKDILIFIWGISLPLMLFLSSLDIHYFYILLPLIFITFITYLFVSIYNYIRDYYEKIKSKRRWY